MINFKEQNDDLLQKVKAFSNKSQGCIFKVNQNEFRFYNADRLHNPFLAETMSKVQDGVVIFNYENNLVFRKDDEFLRFIGVSSVDGITLTVGDRLFVPK